jgi:hypothetical protein
VAGVLLAVDLLRPHLLRHRSLEVFEGLGEALNEVVTRNILVISISASLVGVL